jgi:hypothetical protein
MMKMKVWALLLLIACDRGAPTKQPTETRSVNPAISEHEILEHRHPLASALPTKPASLATAAGCPSSIRPDASCGQKAVMAVAASDPLQSAEAGYCEYPDTHCRCEEDPRTGGAMPRDEDRVFHWRCTGWAPAIWPDGCPNADITAGAACANATLCAYGDEYDTAVYACERGVWVERPGIRHERPPPPPSPP